MGDVRKRAPNSTRSDTPERGTSGGRSASARVKKNPAGWTKRGSNRRSRAPHLDVGPALEARIDAAIAKIDGSLSAQLDAIRQHAAFERLGAAWRGLAFVVDRAVSLACPSGCAPPLRPHA
jgi:hypothetical protein